MHVATMKDYVDQTWGWDDAFQESVFRERYVPAHIQVIQFEDKQRFSSPLVGDREWMKNV